MLAFNKNVFCIGYTVHKRTHNNNECVTSLFRFHLRHSSRETRIIVCTVQLNHLDIVYFVGYMPLNGSISSSSSFFIRIVIKCCLTAATKNETDMNWMNLKQIHLQWLNKQNSESIWFECKPCDFEWFISNKCTFSKISLDQSENT